MARFGCTLCFLFFSKWLSASIEIAENFDFLDVSRQLAIYAPEQQAPVTEDTARLLFSSPQLFASHANESLPLGDSPGGYWIRGAILSSSEQIKTVILTLRYPHLGDASLFLQQADDAITVKRFLRSSTSNNQLVDTDLAFSIPLSSEPTPFLLHVRPTGVSYNVFNVHALVQSLESYDSEKMAKLSFRGLLIGFIVSLFFYNLLLYLLVGYKSYFYYCGYLLGLFASTYSGTGLAYIGPYPLSMSVTVAMLAMAPALAIVFLLQFGRHILHLYQYTPRLDRVYKFLQGLWLLSLPITLLDWPFINTWLLTAQVGSVMSIGVLSYFLHRRYKLTGALVYSVSLACLGSGAILHLGLEVFSFESAFGSEAYASIYRWVENYLFNVSAMVEMILLSAVLASFIRQAEKEKVAAQEEKYILVQDSLLMREQYSTQLETEVQIRTEELKQKNLELKGLQEVRDRFFNYITHEFRSPLNLILGPLKDAKEGRHGVLNKSLQQSITLAQKHAQKMLGLVNHMLELASLRHSRVQLSLVEVNVKASLENLRAQFSLLLTEKHISLEVDDQVTEKMAVWFDQHYFDSIFTNILSNASHRTPPNGRIKVSYSADVDYIEVAIFNSGSYIPPAVQAHIFDPFYTRQGAETAPTNSSGIGLAQVKEYLDVHNGAIMVHSSQEQGTTFTVSLKRDNSELQDELITAQRLGFVDTPPIASSESEADGVTHEKI